MLKAQLDLSVPCPDTQDFQPCMGPGCSDEGNQEERVENILWNRDHSYFSFKVLKAVGCHKIWVMSKIRIIAEECKLKRSVFSSAVQLSGCMKCTGL